MLMLCPRNWRSSTLLVLLTLVLFCACASAAETEQQAPQKGGFLLGLAIWLALFVLCLTLGYAWGKALSIKFDDPGSQVYFQKYIAQKVTPHVTWIRERGPNGELVKLSGTWSCRFCSGITAYVYDSGTGKHHVEPPKPKETDHSSPPRNGLSFAQVTKGFGIAGTTLAGIGGTVMAAGAPAHALAAPAAANAIPNMANTIGNATGLNKFLWVLAAAVAVFSGVWWGYKWGYCNQPKINDRLEKLLEKTVFWQGVANLHNADSLAQGWTFETRNSAVLVKRPGDVVFANVASTGVPATPTPASNLISPSLGLGVGALAGSLGFRTFASANYVATAPPNDVVFALEMAGEKALVESLNKQAGTSLGQWSLGFPISVSIPTPKRS